jgi:hypothetical protein
MVRLPLTMNIEELSHKKIRITNNITILDSNQKEIDSIEIKTIYRMSNCVWVLSNNEKLINKISMRFGIKKKNIYFYYKFFDYKENNIINFLSEIKFNDKTWERNFKLNKILS